MAVDFWVWNFNEKYRPLDCICWQTAFCPPLLSRFATKQAIHYNTNLNIICNGKCFCFCFFPIGVYVNCSFNFPFVTQKFLALFLQSKFEIETFKSLILSNLKRILTIYILFNKYFVIIFKRYKIFIYTQYSLICFVYMRFVERYYIYSFIEFNILIKVYFTIIPNNN